MRPQVANPPASNTPLSMVPRVSRPGPNPEYFSDISRCRVENAILRSQQHRHLFNRRNLTASNRANGVQFGNSCLYSRSRSANGRTNRSRASKPRPPRRSRFAQGCPAADPVNVRTARNGQGRQKGVTGAAATAAACGVIVIAVAEGRPPDVMKEGARAWQREPAGLRAFYCRQPQQRSRFSAQ